MALPEPGKGAVLLDNAGVGVWESDIYVELAEGQNAVIVECGPSGIGANATLQVLDSADPSAGFQATVDPAGAAAGLVAFNKRRVSSLLPFVKVRLTVVGAVWQVRVTPIRATNDQSIIVAGDMNLAQYAGVVSGPANPVDTALVTTEGAGATIGTTADEPFDGAEDVTARTVDSLLKGAKNYIRRAMLALEDVWSSAGHFFRVRETSVAAAAGDVHAPAVNTAAVLNYAAGGPGVSHVLTGVAYSYLGGAPAGGNLKIEDGAGTIVFSQDIKLEGPGVVAFPLPKKGTAATALIVTLAAGGAAVTGKLSALNHYTEA